MATIDRTQLLVDVKSWLPEANSLSDTFMHTISESVIQRQIPSDSDTHFAEAVCKTLRAIAFANNSRYLVDERGLKKETVGDVSIEMHSGTLNPWGDYLESLSDICPIIGYTGLNKGKGFGIQISPSKVLKITDEANASSLIELDITQASTVNNELFL